MTAERNRCRSEAANAGRQADRLTQRLNAMPKVPPPPACSAGLERGMPKCLLLWRGLDLPTQPQFSSLLVQQSQPQKRAPGRPADAAPEGRP